MRQYWFANAILMTPITDVQTQWQQPSIQEVIKRTRLEGIATRFSQGQWRHKLRLTETAHLSSSSMWGNSTWQRCGSKNASPTARWRRSSPVRLGLCHCQKSRWVLILAQGLLLGASLPACGWVVRAGAGGRRARPKSCPAPASPAPTSASQPDLENIGSLKGILFGLASLACLITSE
jgi:hypothetical protein